MPQLALITALTKGLKRKTRTGAIDSSSINANKVASGIRLDKELGFREIAQLIVMGFIKAAIVIYVKSEVFNKRVGLREPRKDLPCV